MRNLIRPDAPTQPRFRSWAEFALERPEHAAEIDLKFWADHLEDWAGSFDTLAEAVRGGDALKTSATVLEWNQKLREHRREALEVINDQT